MATLFMRSYSVEPNPFPPPQQQTYRYAADYKIKFIDSKLMSMAFQDVIITLLWNSEKKQIDKANHLIINKVTSAKILLESSGMGWATIADIPGDDAWISIRNDTILWKKNFTMQVPTSPILNIIPKVGDAVKELGIKTSVVVRAEGLLNVTTRQSGLEVRTR